MFKSFRFALLMAGALFALGAVAQPAPDQQSGNQSDPPSRVARLAYIRGTVSFVPAGENEWVEAQINRPLITGDKLWTDHDSRAELEIGSSALRLDAQTSFDFLNLDDDTAQIELTEGSLNLRVRRLYDNQVYEIDTPTLAFVINRVGEYRLTVLPNGQATVVNVLQGGGDAYGEGGARSRIEEGQSVTFNDSGLRDYYTDSLPRPDSFDEFCRQRDVMAYKQQRHAVLGHQPPNQGDDLCLHDGVERAGRLVGDQQFRPGRDGRGDGHALLLAAGELMREGMQGRVRVGQADAFEQGFGLGVCLGPGEAEMGAGDFGDLFADGHDGIEAGGRVLEDEADVAAKEGRATKAGPFNSSANR